MHLFSSNGASLNDCLYSGCDLLSKTFDILLRFCLNNIGILSDLKKLFWMKKSVNIIVQIYFTCKYYLHLSWYKNVSSLDFCMLPFTWKVVHFCWVQVLVTILTINFLNQDLLKKIMRISMSISQHEEVRLCE